MTYGGGTIFVDHASGFTLVEHQVLLSEGDTISAKRNFERLLLGDNKKVALFVEKSSSTNHETSSDYVENCSSFC